MISALDEIMGTTPAVEPVDAILTDLRLFARAYAYLRDVGTEEALDNLADVHARLMGRIIDLAGER